MKDSRVAACKCKFFIHTSPGKQSILNLQRILSDKRFPDIPPNRRNGGKTGRVLPGRFIELKNSREVFSFSGNLLMRTEGNFVREKHFFLVRASKLASLYHFHF